MNKVIEYKRVFPSVNELIQKPNFLKNDSGD